MADFQAVIIGAGAAGLMAASTAGQRGVRVAILEHTAKIGEKIRISGGGRCNFTNIHTKPEAFISQNPHFCKSALSRYTARDFIALVEKHGIKYHEKTLGQLFCDDSAKQIIDMLLKECANGGVTIKTETTVERLEKTPDGFLLHTNRGTVACEKLVIASGGLSIPKIGASGFGYDVAQKFGLKIIDPAPALVPLTFDEALLAQTKELAGLSVDPVIVRCSDVSFREALLFTHKGLSGPAILQISSYWDTGRAIIVNLCPDRDVAAFLKTARREHSKKMLHTVLAELLPQRLAAMIATHTGLDAQMANMSDAKLEEAANAITQWYVTPSGTEGYRTAEVTKGGLDTDELSSKTFEAKKVPGLYFIGEVVDMTGWLGGYNFQWAWSSGHACGENL